MGRLGRRPSTKLRRQLAGRSPVTVEAGALVTRWQMPFVSRTKRYDPAQVRHLRAASLAWPFAGFARMGRAACPPWFGNPGSVQFDYGARPCHPPSC